MDPTSLPTDNLYKFLALSGLLFAGFLIWFLWTRRQAFLAERMKVEIDHAILTIENDALLRQQERQMRLADAAGQQLEAVVNRMRMLREVSPDHRTEALTSLVDENKKDMEAAQALDRKERDGLALLVARFDAAQAKLASLTVKLKTHEKDEERLAWMQKAATFLVSGALALSALGFVLWYIKAQRFIDAQAQVEAQTKTADVDLKKVELDLKKRELELNHRELDLKYAELDLKNLEFLKAAAVPAATTPASPSVTVPRPPAAPTTPALP